jgi:multiple sugar transport system permease protein
MPRPSKLLAYLVVGGGAAIMVLPFFASLFNSLKSYAQYIEAPPRLLPDPAQWSNYAQVWERAPFGTYAMNSVIIAGLAVAGNVLSSAMVGPPSPRSCCRPS